MNEISKPTRNIGLDVLKAFCAFLVVCGHSTYAGKHYFDPYCRIAIAIFFMITGYFYSSTVSKGRQGIQMKKTLNILAFSIVLYIIWSMIEAYSLMRIAQADASFLVFLQRWTPSFLEKLVHNLPRFLLFNQPTSSEHLWYLSALLYVSALVWLADRYWDRKKLYRLIPVLLLVNLVLGNYSMLLFRREIPAMISRNFLFMGLPCFLLGDLFYQNRSRIRPSKPVLLLVLLLSLAFTQYERIVLEGMNAYFRLDCFVGTIFSAAALFLLATGMSHCAPSPLLSAVARIGRDFTLGIYILHPVILQIFRLLFCKAWKDYHFLANAFFFASPLVAFGLSLAVLLGLRWLRTLFPTKAAAVRQSSK